MKLKSPEMARRALGRVPRLTQLALALSAATSAGLLCADLASAQALEEILVTARFREENLQQTPLAISAISGETLAANGATSVIDVADWAPNVVIDQLGSGWGPTLAATVRGLGYGDFKATSEPTMTIYVDDVVLGRPTGAILDLLDLERVEVLRGPQGTLFGKNAIGGVMRLISRKPGEGEQGGNVELTIGDYDRLDVRGSFETTLIEDKLFSRVSYVSKRRDGWQDNVDFACQMIANGTPQLAGYNDGIGGWTDPDGTGPIVGTPVLVAVGSAADNNFAIPTRTSARGTDEGCVVDTLGEENVQAARGVLRYIASDAFELSVAVDVTDQNSESPYDLLTAANPNTGLGILYNNQVARPNWGVPWDARFIPPSEDVNYAGFNDLSNIDGGIETPNINDVRHWGVSSTFDWTTENLGVKVIVAHREFDAQWGRDSDASPMPINHTLDTFRDDQDTVELRVSGQLFNDKTEWTAGYFYFNADDLNSNISVLYPCLLGTSCIDRVDTQTTENTGIFISTVTQLTDDLSLTVGLRNSDDRKEILQERFNRAGVSCCGFQILKLVEAESTETDPMLSLSYNLNDNIMLYATYQEGFRGGGTTARPTATTRVPFGPETLDNFEIGMKSDLLNNRLRLNVSVFDMNYQDMQIGTAGQDQNGQPAWTTGNDGEATIRGVEVEIQSTIGEHWLIDATIGNTDFQFTRVPTLADCLAKGFPAASCSGFIVIDSSPGRTPEYKASLNFGYTSNLDNGAQISVRYGLSYQDEVFYGANNAPLTRGPAYTLSNARVTWLSADGDWEAALAGTNITDERAIQSKLDFLNLFGTVQTTYVRPEEWALSIKKHF
ncbi:MAG TPA: TonB-dependent receptor [Gammaproteobacteria bacterium]|nr:TonB-dependent receptor [Gammaproteobacteria bacterium]